MFFDEMERITFESCRSKFTNAELQKLQEYGQHVTVSKSHFNFWDNNSEELMEKVEAVFSKWVDSEIIHGTRVSKEGYLVRSGILPHEIEARKKFPELFAIYAPDGVGVTKAQEGENSSDQYDVLGLYLTFLCGLGIEISFESEPEQEAKSKILYQKNTGISIITEDKTRKQMKNMQLPGQQRFELHEDGSYSIVCDDDITIIKALKNKKSKQGYDLFLLEAIGAGIEQVLRKNPNCNGTISIPRTGLQEFLGTAIRVPTQEIIDFILSGKEPKSEREKALYDDIIKSYKFWVDLLSLTKAGTLKTEDGIYVIFQFEGYNEKEDTIECNSPYLRRVYENLHAHPIRGEVHKNEYSYTITKVSPPLLKGSFYKEKNDVAKEIVEEIIARVSMRGTVSDSSKKGHYNYRNKQRVTIKITYQSLIKSCTLLNKKMTDKVTKKNGEKADPDANQKRTILQRAVFGETYPSKKSHEMSEAAKERNKYDSLIEYILRKHTDYFERYVNFKITVDPISLKTLSRSGITITHEGKNGDYQDHPELTSPEVE